MMSDVEKGQVVPLTSSSTTTTTTTIVQKNIPQENKTVKEKIKDVQEKESGFGLYVAITTILIGFVGCTILSVVLSIIPIVMIYFGAAHLDDCPACKFIPVYLIVGGVLGLLSQLLNWFKCRSKERNDKTVATSSKTHFLDVFGLVWFVIGSYWVYSIYKPSYNEGDLDYCHEGTYLLAFSLITIMYCLILLVPLTCCCIGAIVMCWCTSDN